MNNKELIALRKELQGKTVRQIKRSICGEKIGCGMYRDTYLLKSNPDYVVKIERNMSKAAFCNVTEWRNYIENREWKWLAEWLAPCEMISIDGIVLIQQRVRYKTRKDYPKHIPACFTDMKLDNFGWIGDKFVCCDYATLLFYCGQRNKMRYAKWFGTLKYVTQSPDSKI